MLGGNSIALGFSHSCAINSKGNLYVWGSNANQQLTSYFKTQSVIDRPAHVPLKFKNCDYKALSVTSGSNFVFVIGVNKQKQQFILDDDEMEILEPLREILLRKGSLAKFFGLIGKQGGHQRAKQQSDQKNGKARQGRYGAGGGGTLHQFLENDEDDESEGNDSSSDDEALLTEEAELLLVPRGVFIDRVQHAGFTQNVNKIHYLAERLVDENNQGENIVLGDIEDYALGYRQHQCKLFAFGQGSKKIFAFTNKLVNSELDSEEPNSDDSDDYEERQMKKHRKFQNEIIVVSRPTAIRFPKHTRPIQLVACGQGHILVLTEELEMFSWGQGSYGALGHGSRDDVLVPTKLIIQKKDQVQPIIGIACGGSHSMCITKKKKIFSWGYGQGGRLGHGNEDDQLVPKEISELSKKKPIFISSGESHCAVIIEKLKLYTWGSGSFGRLGHGYDNNEKRPKLVEDLDQFEITYVSCGAFHTLCVTGQGHVYGFGQGKYGKLGLSKKERDGIFMIPQKVTLYKQGPSEEELLIQDNSEIVQIQAGYNHSIALAKTGKVMTWGYSGKGILGRMKGIEDHLPLEIGSIPGEFTGKVPKVEDMIQRGDQKQEELFSFEITQVACGQMNTMALTNGGEVYVLGANTWGQLGKGQESQIQKKARRQDQSKEKELLMDFRNSISLIRFQGDLMTRIQFVSCGGEHMFAISRMSELFGWGRNKEGQLGLDFISEFVEEPQLIKNISHKGIQFVSCGDDYSAAVSAFGEVFVAGNLQGGKLGLGQALRNGIIQVFTHVPNLAAIKYVNCGPNHMVAISEYSSDYHDVKDGSTFAWGMNGRGQLGIGSKDNSNYPRKIMNSKERFKKVVCGYDFSIGLSVNNSVYFWGNRKYFCEHRYEKDILEPIPIKFFDNIMVKDIAASYKYCIILSDKGEIFVWGSYLADIMKKKEEKKQKKHSDDNVKSIVKFPQGKFDFLMDTISTGPSHSAAVSVKRAFYTWGNNESFRLGLSSSDAKTAKREPVLVSYVNDLMQKNRQNLKEGIRGGGGGDVEDILLNDGQKIPIIGLSDQRTHQARQEEVKQFAIMPENKKGEREEEKQYQPQNKQDEANRADYGNEDGYNPHLDIEALNQQIVIEAQWAPVEKLNLISLQRQQTSTEAHSLLQKLLKKERKDQLDEDFIIRFDDEIQREILYFLSQFKAFYKIEKCRKDELILIQSAFLWRMSDSPFNVPINPETRTKGIQPLIVKARKGIKEVLTILQIHPCYLIKLYQQRLFSNEDYYKLLKEIYSYQNDRTNYLLISIIQGILESELRGYETLENVNFLSPESVVGRTVKYLFRSQEANLDTVCSIACHIINKLLNKFSSSQTNQDNSFDVTDVLNKQKNKQFDIDKSSKNILLSKRAKDLFLFIEEIIKDINEEEVLYPWSSLFVPKKSLIEDLMRMKVQKQLNDYQTKLQPLRFSAEMAFVVELLMKRLRDMPCKGVIDDLLNSKVLSLVFESLDKVWKDYEVYLYPYVKTVKSLSLIEDNIKKTHYNNLSNIFHVLSCYFKNEQVFADYQTEAWNKELNLKLNHLQQSNKGLILGKIIDNNVMKSVSFKNFENLILHSLDSDNHTITIRKKMLAKIYSTFMNNQNTLTIVKPITEDPLYRNLLTLPKELETLSKCGKSDKMNFKLKTRLFMIDENPVVSRCERCHAVLIQKYAPADTVHVLERYNPEDAQSLMVQYCNILKVIQDISHSESIVEFIDKTFKYAQKNSLQVLEMQMQRFMTKFEIEYKNAKNNQVWQQQWQSMTEDERKSLTVKIKESIYQEIQRQAELKINERRTRKYDLSIIQRRINLVLKRKVEMKVGLLEQKELPMYKETLQNIRYGLANHELKHLADGYQLKHMKKIVEFTTSSKMSKNLFKNLRNEQKLGLRAIMKKKATHLLQNQTITAIVLAQLQPLIKKCEFVFFESEDQNINIKLLFKQQMFAPCGPPKTVSEAILLNFSISQKELLQMRKQGRAMENKRLIFANSIEFDQSKLVKIFNEMERSKSAYVLNSAANPILTQQTPQQPPSNNENRI